MAGDIYGDLTPLGDRLRGMRECLAYIRKEALAFRLFAVAECLSDACDEIEAELDGLATGGSAEMAPLRVMGDKITD